MSAKKTNTQKKKQKPAFWSQHRRLMKWLIGIIGGILLLAFGVYVAFQVSPWPGSLMIRYEFTQGGEKTSKALEKHVPARITAVENQQYRPNDKDGFVDVFYPEGTTTALPTVVWVHGGAWVSGDK